MRTRGTGSIETTRNGRRRARLVINGQRRTIGTYGTETEASIVLEVHREELGEIRAVDGATLGQWGDRVLDQRERDGLRSVDSERNRWKVHVAAASIAHLPIRAVTRADVKSWLDGMLCKRAKDRRGARKLGRVTLQNALNLLRLVLEDATQRDAIAANPAAGVKLPRATGRTEEPWTYLAPAEQTKLLEEVPESARSMVAFAIGTGLRQREQWALRICDVFAAKDEKKPRVIVRFGSPGKATKSGKIRTVPLFGMALEAARAQLAAVAALPQRKNPGGLLFPSVRGNARQKGAPPAWREWIASIGRNVRWHDLRHTCASSLLAGWWGRAWRLEEVCAMLGHSSIKVTERYAHLAGTVLEKAAAETEASHATTRHGVDRADEAGRVPGPDDDRRRARGAGDLPDVGSGSRSAEGGDDEGPPFDPDRGPKVTPRERKGRVLHPAEPNRHQDRLDPRRAKAHDHHAGDERRRSDSSGDDAGDEENRAGSAPAVSVEQDPRRVVPTNAGADSADRGAALCARKRPHDHFGDDAEPELSVGNRYLSRLRDLNSRPTVYETQPVSSDLGPVAPADARQRAHKALALAAAGDPMAWPALVRAVVDLLAVMDRDVNPAKLEAVS